MSVQVFSVRVDAAHLAQDQQCLNDFIASVELVQSDSHFIESDASHWSVILHYKNKIAVPNCLQQHSSLLDLTTEELNRFKQLQQWRSKKATELCVNPIVASQKF